MVKNDPCVSAIIGFIMFLWGGASISLLSWGANWIQSEGDDLQDSVRVWTILAVAGSMFTYAGLMFGGICTAVGAEDAAKSAFGCGGFLGTVGFVGACGCIEIWRTFDGLDSETEKMVGVIGFTGISILYFVALVLVCMCALTCLAGCHSLCKKGAQKPRDLPAPGVQEQNCSYTAPHDTSVV